MNPTIQKYLGGPVAQPADAETALQQPATGLQRMQQRVNQPVTCPVCGSDWFAEVTLQQYADMYSASPGGDMHPISTTSHQIRICICGHPLRPNIGGVRSGRTGNLSTTGVMAAIEGAINSRSQVLGLITKMAEDVVSRAELTAMMETVMQRIDAMESPAASAEMPTPKAATQSAAAKKAAQKAAEPAAEAK